MRGAPSRSSTPDKMIACFITPSTKSPELSRASQPRHQCSTAASAEPSAHTHHASKAGGKPLKLWHPTVSKSTPTQRAPIRAPPPLQPRQRILCQRAGRAPSPHSVSGERGKVVRNERMLYGKTGAKGSLLQATCVRCDVLLGSSSSTSAGVLMVQ